MCVLCLCLLEWKQNSGWRSTRTKNSSVLRRSISPQFQHYLNLFGDCGAYGVWQTKRFNSVLLWPLRVLLRVFLTRETFDQRKAHTVFAFDLVQGSSCPLAFEGCSRWCD